MSHLHMATPARLLFLASLLLCTAAASLHETDSIIVRMEADASAFSVQSDAGADPAADLGSPIGDNLRRITLNPGEELQQQLERLKGMAGVKYAVPDLRIYPQSVKLGDAAGQPASGSQQGAEVAATLAGLPTRESFKQQWGAIRIGLPSAWSIATGASSKSKAINVCVVDSGVDVNHPDLKANLAKGFNAVNGEDRRNPQDQVGHGTEVTGVIAASGADGGTLGVNWGHVNILSCKFMSADGWGKTSDAIQCMDWCLKQRADVISASWTCGQLGNPPLEEAVSRTKEAGVLLVVAAGNQGADLARTPYFPQAYSATHDNMLVVGASDEYDEHAFFSNYDPATVHMSAPGNWIYSTAMGGGYNFSSGTSIAAPFVSGSAALLMAAAQDKLNKTLSALEVKAALMNSTEKFAALARRTATGGRLRTDWALQKLLGLELSGPTPCVARPGDSRKCREHKKHGHSHKKDAASTQHKKQTSSGSTSSSVKPSSVPAAEAQQQLQQQQAATPPAAAPRQQAAPAPALALQRQAAEASAPAPEQQAEAPAPAAAQHRSRRLINTLPSF